MASAGLENVDFYKVLLREGRDVDFRLSRYGEYLEEVDGALIMDSGSVYDLLTTDSGKLPTDRRLAIDLCLVQFYLQAPR